jgi:predicted acyltransferase
MSGRQRILSIDLLRGLDVLLMLFVNEVAGVSGAPAFLLHASRDADAMTVTDVVFPAFLFITGMSIPFALGGRLARGDAPASVWRHVLARTAALLTIGVLMVNVEHAGPGPLSLPLWNVLMTAGVVLVWHARDGQAGGGRWRAPLRLAGALLLVALVFLYRAEGGAGVIQVRPYWWGILGLIGWAYLVSAAAYLLAGERPAVLTGLVALLYCLYFADAAGGILAVLHPVVNVGSALGSHAAVTLSGTVLGVALRRHLAAQRPLPAVAWQTLGIAVALATAGALLHSLHGLHPAFTINKIRATAPWCLFSSAATAAAWAALFVLADVAQWRRWPAAVVAAGENALVAYLLAPFFLSLFAMSAPLFGGTDPYAALGLHTAVGLVRSAAFAWFVVWVTGVMRRAGVHLHL